MELAKDVSRCANDKCALKRNCKRYLAEANENPVWFSEFKPKKSKCAHQIKIS